MDNGIIKVELSTSPHGNIRNTSQREEETSYDHNFYLYFKLCYFSNMHKRANISVCASSCRARVRANVRAY